MHLSPKVSLISEYYTLQTISSSHAHQRPAISNKDDRLNTYEIYRTLHNILDTYTAHQVVTLHNQEIIVMVLKKEN